MLQWWVANAQKWGWNAGQCSIPVKTGMTKPGYGFICNYPPPYPPENTCSKLRRDMRFVGENWRNIWNQSPTWGCRFEFLDKKPIVWFAGRWAGGRTIWNYACIKQDTSIRLWTRRPKFAIEWDKFTKKVTAWLYLLCLILVHPASSPLPVAFPSVN